MYGVLAEVQAADDKLGNSNTNKNRTNTIPKVLFFTNPKPLFLIIKAYPGILNI